MQPIQRILVPIDFSPLSDAALEWAADMARQYGARLTLVHIFQLPVYPMPEGYVVFPPTQLEEMLAEFSGLLASAETTAKNLGAAAVDTELLQGSTAKEIVNFAEVGKYDLIVMGTHGRGGIGHALLGSVAEKVLRKAPCPVLTIRAALAASKTAGKNQHNIGSNESALEERGTL